ncbi:Short-chain dehydrogenase/reductase SDR [Penicillium robsamsonii]|uniref:Short-chain dehydrogenase/reductase SDR n=1 Tax=Penicillium robsamsonii TaxID=1792511 RepID=UPI0025475E06|nr:Short-chain dehydrogenase/reductase SDR [Penicillium robsamsonii]KAJ5835121.1 Short-chain dehydrogenase/reductase SDR [Penicillium robsamsonii]
MAVMQTGTFLTLKYGSRAMSMTSSNKPNSKGNIVVTSSYATLIGAFADLAYTTAKNGCNGLVRSRSVQLFSSNICVNAVAPGPTSTSLLSTLRLVEEGVEYKLDKTAEEIWKQTARIYRRYYYNRCAAPEEIANVAISLASELASAINCCL